MSETPPPEGPETLAAAARERRDVVSGEVMPEARLIRFVAGPDGAGVPDLARKLPGRGMWGEATREAGVAAGKKNGFGRSAQGPLEAPAERERTPLESRHAKNSHVAFLL